MTNKEIENNQIEQLITTLGEDFELTGEEIADVLWFAVQRKKNTVNSNQIRTTEAYRELITQIGNSLTQKQPETTSSVKLPSTLPQRRDTAPLYPETSSSDTAPTNKVLPIRVPDASSLREPLQLAQALRPLMRKIVSERKIILDEIATAKRTADYKIYLPVLKPQTEPWLDLALVVDESQSMVIWRHTIEDLKRLVQHYGVFRDVRVWGLVTNDTREVKLLPRMGRKGKEQRFANPRELIDPNGRRLILVVSDCVSRLWHDGTIIPPLKDWSQRQPLAIIQMLPDWLWLRTGLGNGASVLFKSLAPGIANQKLQIDELLLRKDFELSEGIKIPVFALDKDLASVWSEMVAGKSEAVTSGFIFPPQLDLDEKSLPETEVAQLDAQGRITRFRQTASPIARNLAGLLAAAPVINLPVVRLIQDTLLPQSNQVHVAEVFLGGLLKPLMVIEADTNPDTVQYDFMNDGIRQIFLKDAPVSNSAQVFDAVSQYVAHKINKSLQDFVALLRAPRDNTEESLSAFADVAIKVLKGLGGVYARFAEDIEAGQNFEMESETVFVDKTGTIIERKLVQAYYYSVNIYDSTYNQEDSEYLENKLNLDMVYIPGGKFIMGSSEDEKNSYDYERPPHLVNVPSFYMSKYPITQGQWKAIALETDLKVKEDLNPEPSYFKDNPQSFYFSSTRGSLDLPPYRTNPTRWHRPVDKVNWYQAKEFCARLSKLTEQKYRLPSESEWEYACRAINSPPDKGSYPLFHFGETITSDLANYRATRTYADEPKGVDRKETTPVGTFPPNAFGLYDMHGNVWEWCEDYWHDNYQNAPQDGSAWITAASGACVIRGGSWYNYPAACRSAVRGLIHGPEFLSDYVGFRVVRGC